MIELTGNYFLKVDFGVGDGKQNVNIDAQNMEEFTIVQDMYKFLPEVRIQLKDPQGILTHLIPFDKFMSSISVQLGRSLKGQDEWLNDFDFSVFRRMPYGEFGPGATYDVRGLLDMEGLYLPQYCRTFNQSVMTTLTQIAIDELKCDEVEISPSLDYPMKLLQPSWSNIEFLNELKEDLIGRADEGAFCIFIKRYKGKSILVCKTLEDLYKGNVIYKFIINDEPVQDFFPVLDYEIIDNYKFLGIFGAKAQKYSYFDYYGSQFVNSEVTVGDYYSLTDFFLIDGGDSLDSTPYQDIGRNNELTRDFHNFVKAKYYSRLNNLVKMWIYTWGLSNIVPGDIVKVLFAQGKESGNLQGYQFSGYWLVERVVHMLGDTHRMRLLLTRNGVDTDKGADTSLLQATRKRQ